MILLYLAGASPRWQITPDSALYLMLGENMAHGQGYTLHGEPHAFVPPGFPLFLAGLMRVSESMYWLNLAAAAVAVGAIAMSYRLLRCVVEEREAMLLTAAFAATNTLFVIGQCQLSDMLFLLLVFTGVWACLRGLEGKTLWFWLATAALLASCWVRVVGLPLAGAVAVGLWLQPRRVSRRTVALHSLVLVVGLAATAGFFHHWQDCHRQTDVPQETYLDEFNRWEVSDRTPLDWVSFPLRNAYQSGRITARFFSGQGMPHAVGALFFGLPVLIGMGSLLARKQRLVVLVLVVYLGAILCLRPLIARYLLPVGPLLWLCFAEGVGRLLDMRSRWRTESPRWVAACLIALTIANVVKDGKAVYRAHDPRYPAQRQFYLQTADSLRAHSDAGPFVGGGQAASILARLSGVPHRDFYALFGMSKPSADEVLGKLDEADVRLVVIWPDEAYRPFERVLAKAIARRPDFRLVSRNEIIAVYRRETR